MVNQTRRCLYLDTGCCRQYSLEPSIHFLGGTSITIHSHLNGTLKKKSFTVASRMHGCRIPIIRQQQTPLNIVDLLIQTSQFNVEHKTRCLPAPTMHLNRISVTMVSRQFLLSNDSDSLLAKPSVRTVCGNRQIGTFLDLVQDTSLLNRWLFPQLVVIGDRSDSHVTLRNFSNVGL